jgi:hypothetical protein
MEDHPMTNHESRRLHRRTLLTGSATLGVSAIIACDTSKIAVGQQIMATVEQNTTKRRGVGLRALNPERASAGFTLFAPLIWKNKNSSVYLIDLHGNVVHTWDLPYPPGLSGYLTERGTLFYNGRTSEESFLSRFPFKGGVVLEADWNGKVLWPFFRGPPTTGGNLVFRALRYSAEEIARARGRG